MDGERFSFGPFCLDLDRRRLLLDEKPVRLGSRALDILCVLASAEGKVVSKDQLMARVWPGVVVEENNLHVHISALRKVLDEEGDEQSCLVTVPGRGYRLLGLQNVEPRATPLGDPSSTPPTTSVAYQSPAPPLSSGSRSPDQAGAEPHGPATTASTRRLIAILAADVAGYSRVMGVDEEGTHERLKAHLRTLVDPKIKEHRGRTVKSAGDGFLAQFSSVINALRCAVEVQRGMVDREREMPEDRRIRFRIGVNIGDVIVDEDDIFGDGVNVAARLEALAEPNGICVSGVVRDQVRDKLDYNFEDLGEQHFKNIARPIRVYAVRPEDAAYLLASSAFPRTPVSGSAAPRLSIVVLPFTNLTNDPNQQYFADGVTDDLTTDLSRIPHMFVISRNTAFTFKDKPTGAKQIGFELGVRYLLEGSVRRSGNRIRVNAQLIDAQTSAHLWAERFDHDTLDLFALQNEITSRIAIALNTELVTAEVARPPINPDTLDYLLRGRAAFSKPPTRNSLAEAIDWIERALALDPQSVEAQSYLAWLYAFRIGTQMTETVVVDMIRAEELIARALAVSPENPLAHLAKCDGPGRLDSFRGRIS
jgi:TolB-like protein/class 3 adenylate cyclase